MTGYSISAALRSSVTGPARDLIRQFFATGLTRVLKNRENVLLWSYSQFELSPFLIYQGYVQGKYPLPSTRHKNQVNWYDPEVRGIIPVDHYKIRNDLLRRLKKEKRSSDEERIQIKVNANFRDTILSCTKPRGVKNNTWISNEYVEAGIVLHDMGIAHSVEAYQNGILVGGLVGLSINGFFATLSLFHTVDNASKIAFCYLLQKLKDDGFKLHHCGDVDSWFTQYGMIPIAREPYRKELMLAVTQPVRFTSSVPALVF
jgi:leucyl/phenylalanyl-tRNA--protein transferase